MRLKCLSIQQPYANLVMAGVKRVENRSRNWLKDRDWRREGPVLLGIHASRRIANLNEEELDEFVPGWREGAEVAVGVVLGVIEVLEICRPADLPAELRGNRHVNNDPENWCWVFGNPQLLKEELPASGQAWLFNVEVPEELLPAGVRVEE